MKKEITKYVSSNLGSFNSLHSPYMNLFTGKGIGTIYIKDGYDVECDVCAMVVPCICMESDIPVSYAPGRICKECAKKAFDAFGVGEVERDYIESEVE